MWNDATRTLSVGARKGKFAGLVRQRELQIVLMSPSKASRVVQYSGTPLSYWVRRSTVTDLAGSEIVMD